MKTLKNLVACALALVMPAHTWAQTEIEPNNGSGTATVLTYNTPMTGRMGVCSPTDNSTDYFKIVNMPQGQMRVQSSMSNTGPVDLEVTIQVRQTTTSVIGTYTLTAGANGVPVNDSFVFPCQGPAGNYYFSLVNPSATYCTNYTFTVDAIAPVFANDPEPNNGGSSAVPVAVNTWQEGQANFYYGDNGDYYRLDLPTSGVLNIEWEAEHAGPTASTATVILRNTTTAAIQTWTLPVGANSIPASDLASITCRSNTNYYLLSISSNICGTSYRFRYTVSPPVFGNDPESNNGSGTAVTIPIDVPQDGQLNFLTYNENADYYRLYLPDDGILSLNVAAEHVGSDASGTLSLSLRRSNNTAVIETWTVPVGANSTPLTTLIERPCTGSTSFYYLSISSSICGASYRFSYSLDPAFFENDLEPNDSQFTTPWVNLNDSSVTGHMQFYYDSGSDGYKFNHFGDTLVWDMSAEHTGTTPGVLYASFRNASYHNVLFADTIVVGANGVPNRSVHSSFGPIPAQAIRVYFSTPTCGVSYRWNCVDADGDGVCDGADLCSNTPTGEGVNDDGCSCSQVIVSDGDACTLDACLNGTVTHTFQDADSDGTCDASDGCPNDVNKITPGACGCGVADIDSDSDGLADCNDNCPSTPGQIGSACDDGNANTNGDVVSGTCICAGSTIPCPDDGNTCTLEIVLAGTCTHQPLPDTDTDGTCDLNDGCPNDPNKIAAGTCGCGTADTDTDSDGTADCNDGCPGDANKTAPGSCGCGVADTDSDSDATADCNDGCPSDPDKTNPGACGCGVADTDNDNDGIANCSDNCPNLAGQVSSPCDDGDANTIGDAIGANCQCAGTPSCTTDLEIVFQTDGSSTIDWELREQGTNVVVQSGGGLYPASPNYALSTCLPNGNYYLVVTDDGCNGISNGGYFLRTVGGTMLIDDRNNFLSGCTSQIAGGEGFTLPVGTDRLVSTSCDKLDWRTNEFIVASDNAAVTDVWNNFTAGSAQRATTGYEMWWYDPNGGYTFRRFQSHATTNGMTANAVRACHFKINSWSGSQLLQGVLYNVKVRSRVIGANAAWGPACRFILDPVRAECPLTHLLDTPGNQYLSCGATRAVGSGAANLVHAKVATRVVNSVSSNANKYQFRFITDAGGSTITKTSSTGQYWVNTAGLAPCKTYEVEVRASFDNGTSYCDTYAASNPYAPKWGRVCLLNTSGCPNGNGGNQSMAEDVAASTSSAQLNIYPNPNNGEQLFLHIDQVKEGVSTICVDIHDSFGKRVSTSTIAVGEGLVNTVIELKGEMAAGMYLVNITMGDEIHTERLVIQP